MDVLQTTSCDHNQGVFCFWENIFGIIIFYYKAVVIPAGCLIEVHHFPIYVMVLLGLGRKRKSISR